jgi:glycosyltransferase involved in cell wall biosynthesis
MFLMGDHFTITCSLLALFSFGLLACNFLLAPILRLMWHLSRCGKENTPCPLHSISIIVPAYNEENNIETKIDTLRHALQHVDVEAEVIIGLDGCTDRTAEIVAARLQEINSPSWRLLEFSNEGKCCTLNKLVDAACGEVIISTDADIPVPENAIELVVRAFQSNARLGCISCIPGFGGLNIGSQKSYWRIEDQIRRAESELGRLIVVTGMLYAYKRELFEEIPKGVMADDLWIPLNVLLKGHESVQGEDLLVPYEKTDEETEIMRRNRVIVGGMDVVRRLRQKILKSPSLFLLVTFHKVNRWAMPLWLFTFLGALVALWHWFMIGYIFLAGCAFCFLGKKRFYSLAYAGITPLIAFAEVMRKKDFARWEHTRKL